MNEALRATTNASPLGTALADLLVRLSDRPVPELRLAAELVCAAVNRGHICLDLAGLAAGELDEEFDLAEDLPVPASLAAWRTALEASGVVGPPGAFQPLILDAAGRLYLHRYREYEETLAAALLQRVEGLAPPGQHDLAADLERYFPQTETEGPDGQKIAAALALTRRLCVISGGPGTGKTTTVVKILALLREQAGATPLAIALAAPTGKAAARLQDAIRSAKQDLPAVPEIAAAIPNDVKTLHRLLGLRRHSAEARHGPDRPLPVDVLVIDEASMVDLPLLTRTVRALPPAARLILVGDKDQLASVEAGAVLGDLCAAGETPRYSAALSARLADLLSLSMPSAGADRVPAIADCLVTLDRSYRFGPDSGIARLSACVNRGDAPAALDLLNTGGTDDLAWLDCPPPAQLAGLIQARLLAGFDPLLTAPHPADALAALDRYLVLCALRSGPYGVTEINRLAERVLARRGLLAPVSRWYKGRPIMITTNDYQLGLYNGDTGIIWADPDRDGELRAFFPDPANRLRSFAPARLPAHQTAFATTVHKSQGSEYRRVLLLLPPHDSRALTRELIYTGLTRAREAVEICAHREVFARSLQRRVQRSSGLRDALWGSEPGI